MADGSIDSLSIEISSTTDRAVNSLTALVNKLGNLETKLGTTCPKLISFNHTINLLNSALSKVNLSGLKDLSGVKVSSTLSKNLKGIADALEMIPAGSVAKLRNISTAFSGLKGVSLSKSTVNNLQQLPVVFKEYEKLNMSALATQIGDLNRKIAPLAINISRLASAYKSLPRSMQTAGTAARSVAASNRYLSESNKALEKSNSRLGTSIGSVTSRFGLWARSATTGLLSFAGFTGVFDATIGNVNSYIENMNLFEASMGKYTQAATEYGMKIQDALGIDFGEWARNQGVFQTLMTGMGETADRAAIMSQQMTQLGYDIASFYNLDVDTAMLKIQSGIAGELEPLRRLGWDLSNARMQLEATKLGIDKSVQSMTQAEKVGLRYHLIMTQVTQTHGDMARTIMSPANQLRVLKSQIVLAARAIGNLFIPMLNAVLPYVIAFTKAIRFCAESIASIFGWDLKFEVDYSTLDTSGISTGGTDALADSLDNADKSAKKAKKSAQEYKNTVMGFDELNKLNDTPENNSGSGSGTGGAGAGGGGLDIPLEQYDFLAGLKDNLSAMTDEMAQGMVKLLPYIGAVASGLAAWKIASSLGAQGKKLFGIVMTVAGAVLFVTEAFDAWNNGVDFSNVIGMIAGISAVIGGFALMGQPFLAALAAIVGGVAMVVIAFKDMLDQGPTPANVALFLAGLGLVFGGLMALSTSVSMAIAPFVLLAGGIAAVVLGFKDFLENGPTPANVALIVAGIGLIGLALSALIGGPIPLIIAAVVGALVAIGAAIYSNWDAICAFFAGIGEWFNTNVIQPVASFFSGLWEGITTAAGDAWQAICDFFAPAIDFFTGIFSAVWAFIEPVFNNIAVIAQGCWMIIQAAWEIASTWFNDTIITPLVNFFTTAWNVISTIAKTAWSVISGAWNAAASWFNNTIIQPISKFFSGLWNGVVSFAQNAWNKISSIFSAVGGFFGGVASSLWGAFKSIVNSVFQGINRILHWIFGGINQIISKIKGFEVLGMRPFGGLQWLNVPQIPYLAEGRYGINAGQLFVARESGPEMVGKMGSHTTVANNDQIVEGIEAGVYNAVIQAHAVTGGGGESDRPIELTINLDGEVLARKTIKNVKTLQSRGLAPSFGV